MVKAVGEDGVDNLHDYRHDISKVGRLGAQGLLVDDAVHLADDTLAVRRHPSSSLVIAGAPSVVTHTRRDRSRECCFTH